MSDPQKKISVLYIQHCGVLGGSSRSLYELINALHKNSVDPKLIIPKGSSKEVFEKIDIPIISPIGVAQYDYYEGYRWFAIFRELLFVIPTLFVLVKAKCKWKDIDIVHINDWTMLLPVIFSRFLFRKPIVLHARCINSASEKSIYNRVLFFIYSRYVNIIIPIDNTVARSLDFLNHNNKVIIHNGFTDVNTIQDPIKFTFQKRKLTVAMVGNFMRIKGHYEFLESAKIICKNRGLDVNFILVGENPKDYNVIMKFFFKIIKVSINIEKDLREYVRENCLEPFVHFLGTIIDINKIYSSIDVLCFPSYLNAVGRPVFESGFSRVPSIVAIENPFDDTIIDGETGICIKAKDPVALANAIQFYYDHPLKLVEMGNNAHKLANKNFDIICNAEKMLTVYRNLLN